MIINLLATWIPALGIAFLGVLKLLGNSRLLLGLFKGLREKIHFDSHFQLCQSVG
jgi:hypothetical protein